MSLYYSSTTEISQVSINRIKIKKNIINGTNILLYFLIANFFLLIAKNTYFCGGIYDERQEKHSFLSAYNLWNPVIN
jgi:hypothetical protein